MPPPSPSKHPYSTRTLPFRTLLTITLLFLATINSSDAQATADPASIDIAYNLGPQGAVPGSRKTSSKKTITNIPPGIPASVFSTARYGKEFNYSFTLPPGSYDIIIGVTEFYWRHCTEPGKRIFHTLVNGVIHVEGYDIFADVGCYHAKRIDITGVTVGAVDTKPLVVGFQAVANFAQVAYIRVVAAKTMCIPESTTGYVSADHAAHAVPGSYPPQVNKNSPLSYVDLDGDGFFKVNIDGSDSHTHFEDAANGVVGKITKYTWTLVETGEVISTSKKFEYRFPLGTTRLRLSVLDNSCTTDEAETTVTVTGKMQAGAYCYFYDDMTAAVPGTLLTDEPRPLASEVSKSLDFSFPSLPFPASTFVARCQFFLDRPTAPGMVKLSANTGSSGYALVYKGEDLILDTQYSTSVDTTLVTGLTAFEAIYVKNVATASNKLTLTVGGSVPNDALVKHDQSTVVPILTAASPNTGKVAGGTKVKITGYGLYLPQTVSFGSKTVKILPSGATKTQFFVASPAVTAAGSVDISTTSSGGLKSNAIKFTYGGVTCDDVAFEKSAIYAMEGGKKKEIDFLRLPTVVTLGPDKRLYMGTMAGTVEVLTYNPFTMKARSHCSSPRIRDARYKKPSGDLSDRVVLGIAFNPKIKAAKPYVSTSTLYWHSQSRIARTNGAAWRNGAVDRLKVVANPGSFVIGKKSGECLAYDTRIVSNLPVSNRDHSINALLFTQDGDLLIAVGGNTNEGLPGVKLGNLWETPLSAAIVIAKTSKFGFNGNITYSNDKVHYLAKQKGGDVQTYATGFRNLFTMGMTKSGDIYAADQGANCNYGDVSLGCEDYDAAKAATWGLDAAVDWPGRFSGGPSKCPKLIPRRDKVVHVVQGKFYGHSNLQRGVAGECAWIDPFTDKTADGKAAPSNYKSNLAILPSSVTCVAEYRSTHFCGKLRGDLLLSSHQGRRVWRMGVLGGGKTSGPDLFSSEGGIQFVEDHYGNLIYPRFSEKRVDVYKPKISAPITMQAVGIWPWRFGKKGGMKVYIGGYNMPAGAKVYVDEVACAGVKSSKGGRELSCTVPPLRAGRSTLVDIRVVSGSQESVLDDALLYLNK